MTVPRRVADVHLRADPRLDPATLRAVADYLTLRAKRHEAFANSLTRPGDGPDDVYSRGKFDVDVHTLCALAGSARHEARKLRSTATRIERRR